MADYGHSEQVKEPITRVHPKASRKYKVIAGCSVAVLLLLFFALLYTTTQTVPSARQQTAASTAQNGTYTLGKQEISCAMGNLPLCSGQIVLQSPTLGTTEATIDYDTKVRYAKREIQIYANELRVGMQVEVTFQPGSTTVAQLVIAE